MHFGGRGLWLCYSHDHKVIDFRLCWTNPNTLNADTLASIPPSLSLTHSLSPLPLPFMLKTLKYNHPRINIPSCNFTFCQAIQPLTPFSTSVLRRQISFHPYLFFTALWSWTHNWKIKKVHGKEKMDTLDVVPLLRIIWDVARYLHLG